MPQASHGTRATVRQSCVSSAQQVAQARAEGQAPGRTMENQLGKWEISGLLQLIVWFL